METNTAAVTPTTDNDLSIMMDGVPLQIGQTVYARHTEEYWDKGYVKKRHHNWQIKSVILKVRVMSVANSRFTGQPFENNGFEHDGEFNIFRKGSLLCDQNFTATEELGIWQMDKSSD